MNRTMTPVKSGMAKLLSGPAQALVAAAALTVSGCMPVKLVATTNIPTPLVVKIPVSVGLHVPKEFSGFVHDEERSGTDWHIDLGKAQTDGLMRLLTAMFDRVVVIDSVSGAPAGTDIRAVLEPSVEEYAFVTPRDAGTPLFAVSIKYRINVYTPDGRLADSWGFTGYGSAPSQGLTSDAPLTQATALAMRDAGAKLAVEFRDQAIVRGLIPETAVPDTPVPAPGSAVPASTPASDVSEPIPAAGEATDTEDTAPAEATPAEPVPPQAVPEDAAPTSTDEPMTPEKQKPTEPVVPESLV